MKSLKSKSFSRVDQAQTIYQLMHTLTENVISLNQPYTAELLYQDYDHAAPLLVCLQHLELHSATALRMCSWFDLLCEQAGSFLCWCSKHSDTCLISGTSPKKASKL